MKNIQKLIIQRKVEDINVKYYDLEKEVNLLFDEIQSNLKKPLMLEEPIIVKESSDFSDQTYTTTIFGLTKRELLGCPDDVTHLSYYEINEKELTEPIFDYITLQDKIYLLEHIIDNLNEVL